MDKFDWYILNSLSDDHETIETMRSGLFDEDMSDKELGDRIFLLFNLGLLNAFNEKGRLIEDFSKNDIHNDTWFGLTELGGQKMEETALELAGEEISWETSYTRRLDYKNSEGHIYARTQQRCIELLNEIYSEDKVIVIEDSINIFPVESYHYKYYKTLIGGYKMIFKFRKKDEGSAVHG